MADMDVFACIEYSADSMTEDEDTNHILFHGEANQSPDDMAPFTEGSKMKPFSKVNRAKDGSISMRRNRAVYRRADGALR